MYKRQFTEKDDVDVDELIGWLKGSFKTIKQVKGCAKFKALSEADKEYVLDELKADGFKESVMKEAINEKTYKQFLIDTVLDVANDYDDVDDVMNVLGDVAKSIAQGNRLILSYIMKLKKFDRKQAREWIEDDLVNTTNDLEDKGEL